MNADNERYIRHYSLRDFGIEGQQKLFKASVLVIGAGGLGCPVLQYLVAAGTGTLGIIDHDTVSISNLQRQTLYRSDDIGLLKVDCASESLKKLNPEVSLITYPVALTPENAWEIIAGYDLIIDCTDNFSARYLINDACVLLDKPLIFGAVYRYEGQVAVFNVAGENGCKVNYRHLFPEPPAPDEIPDCNEAGVLGVLPGMIGIMQANEAIKLITGIGKALKGQLLTFSMLTYDLFTAELTDENQVSNLIPKDRETLETTDYRLLCGLSASGVEDLGPEEFYERMKDEKTMVVDVREQGELPLADFPHRSVPLSRLNENLSEFRSSDIILFCQSGKRSLKAAGILMHHFGAEKRISHLKNGILALQNTEL
ncbi:MULTISPECIES: HesA/MoeB/ThiF family protein [Chryseobacterium]|uniref:Molybdopterin/thiamine biosynthesis adenylyltransferase/rhodanese-related sulfurtransferase n=1 Tax=Chryseobacterium camelliae TaxID=1265445 RepID=A0ABU0TFS8_9FLAO|nr:MULTISPECIES: HesA/MoeB/ThiF family protein [Chryseobacterium]MDT3406288.1 molybdopterin/thiamine biosynthesis adenylyltransferase/rhodanese-related sulfurtransferase [Pseudacidovorax intermedius]MDQ1095914.1 molybdopterin/thiamine biosynthesis adenylyltransferase/rhodanese-related sulfurtransferase [Chryseobacterium camelliae]MDQ1099850.1 molybdopterin/thiamine biosynthesis adenylyltransferase/rhodanese-related sulfurtransferase [Chryseobacterium sp. SORGH_AS_1048]MDR6087196.1 molybdopterin